MYHHSHRTVYMLSRTYHTHTHRVRVAALHHISNILCIAQYDSAVCVCVYVCAAFSLHSLPVKIEWKSVCCVCTKKPYCYKMPWFFGIKNHRKMVFFFVFCFRFTQYHKKYALVCQRPIINIHHFPSKTIAINCNAKGKHKEQSEQCNVEWATQKTKCPKNCRAGQKIFDFSSWYIVDIFGAYMNGLRCESGKRITSSFTNECAMWESLKNAFEHVHKPLKCTHIWVKRLQCFPF